MRSLALPAIASKRPSGSAREWIIAAAGGVVLAAGLVALLRPASPDETAELTTAAPGAAHATDTAPPAPLLPQAATPIAAPLPPTADISGLVLRGVMGAAETGAVIVEFPGGRQGSFTVGRDVLPGVKLTAIEPQSAVFSVNGSEVRIALPGAEIASLSRATPPKRSAANGADQTVAFRTGLTARKREDGRIIGFAIRPGVDMPAFAKAGLRPGDVVTSINGRAFASEDEVNKLAGEIAISATVVFEYERNGKRAEARLDPASM